MKNVYVGIDIGKNTLDFCVRSSGGASFDKIGNKTKSIRKLLKSIAKIDSKAFIAVENTGYYNYNLYQSLEDFDFNIYVIDPKHIKRSIGLVRGKNDKVDAKKIAIFIERNHQDFQCWEPCSEAIRPLKILMGQRRSKTKQRQGIKQQMADLKDIVFNSSTGKLIKINQKAIKELDRHIHEIETLIRAEIKSAPVLQEQLKRIKTVPGIGDVTAWMIAIKTEGFQRLTDPRKLACFAGVVPFEQQSGTSLKTRPRVSKMQIWP